MNRVEEPYAIRNHHRTNRQSLLKIFLLFMLFVIAFGQERGISLTEAIC